MTEQSIDFNNSNLGKFEGKEKEYIAQMLLLQNLIFAGFSDYVNFKLHEYEKEGLCTSEMYILYIQSCIMKNARAYAVKHAIDFLKKHNNDVIVIEKLLTEVQKPFFVGEQIISLIKGENIVRKERNQIFGSKKGNIKDALYGEWLSFYKEKQSMIVDVTKNKIKKNKKSLINLVDDFINSKEQQENMEEYFYAIDGDDGMSEKEYKDLQNKQENIKQKFNSLLDEVKNELQKTTSQDKDKWRIIRLFLYDRDDRIGGMSEDEARSEEKLNLESLCMSDSEIILFYLLKGRGDFKIIKSIYERIKDKNIFLFIDIFLNFRDDEFNSLELIENIIDSEDKKREYDEYKKYFFMAGIDNSILSLIEKRWGNIQLKIKLEKDGEELKAQMDEQKKSLEEGRQTLEKDKIIIARSQALVDKQIENSFNVLLKRRTELEYALSKSAIDELGFDDDDFYNEMQSKVDRIRDANKMKEGEILPPIKHFSLDKKLLTIIKTWFRSFFLKNARREQLNYVLPTLRASYLGEWKEFLMNAGRKVLEESEQKVSKENDLNNQKISSEKIRLIDEKMSTMIGKFDEILGKDLDRSMKSKIFTSLMWFFLVETIIVFVFAWLMQGNPNMKILLNILIPVTIVQVTGMIYHMLTSLFPDGKKKEEEKEKTALEWDEELKQLKAKRTYEEELDKKNSDTDKVKTEAEDKTKTENVDPIISATK